MQVLEVLLTRTVYSEQRLKALVPRSKSHVNVEKRGETVGSQGLQK